VFEPFETKPAGTGVPMAGFEYANMLRIRPISETVSIRFTLLEKLNRSTMRLLPVVSPYVVDSRFPEERDSTICETGSDFGSKLVSLAREIQISETLAQDLDIPVPTVESGIRVCCVSAEPGAGGDISGLVRLKRDVD